MVKSKIMSVRISEDLDKKLSTFSKENFYSRSNVIKISLKKFLEGSK